MAIAWRELQAEAPRNKTLSLEAFLLRLLDAEQADRQARSLRYQLKAARFPIHRDLTAFDWSETPLDGARIQQLAKEHYLETAHNLILVGGTGTGKTHLAIALGVAAIHHGMRIRFYNAVDLVNLLEKEKAFGEGKSSGQSRKSGQATHPDRRVRQKNDPPDRFFWPASRLDELGNLPFPASGGALRSAGKRSPGPFAIPPPSTSSANSTKKHPSSSQPISASPSGSRSSAMPR